MKPNDPQEPSFFEQLKIYYQSRYAPALTRIEENEGSRLATATVAVIGLLIFVFILWASFTPVEEIAVTFGEVIPKEKVYTVQSLEGGVIGNILVKEGDEVHANQALVKFDPTIPQLELEQLRARNAALIENSQYLEKLLEEDQKAKETTEQKLNNQSNNPDTSSTKSVIFKQENAKLEVKIGEASKSTNKEPEASPSLITSDNTNVINIKEQALEDLSKFESILDILKKRLAILIQEKEMYETLLKTGSVAKKDYLALLRTITDVQEEISKTHAARVETQYAIDKLQDRIHHIEIRTPIHGLVKGLQLHVGNIIQPGGALMDIVPLENLMVETKIFVRDIGHVKIGASVRIKVAAYDYTRYGMIMGKLVHISATTFVDPLDKTPYYKGLVELEKSYVGEDAQKNRLLPGMTVEADINTGVKSLLQYLLRPVQVLVDSSFREH